MAGFVAIYDIDSSPILLAENFQKLLNLTCQFKDLPIPGLQAVGQNCIAAKIDASSSLHHRIVFDETSGSWIMVAGTVVALEGNNDPTILLKDLMTGFVNNGVKVFERFDGHFGLVIYNGRDQSLSIISDPMGLFAIYYAHIGQRIYISTSALAVAKHTQSKADLLTIECFLRAGRVHGEKTFWEEVKRVRPANLIKITSENFEELAYWKPKIDENIAKLSLNEALVIADEKITHVYNKLFSSKERVWADLTGGFDTRVTVMYLAKSGIPFTAYCVGRRGHPDVEISRLIAKEMGWDYRHLKLPDIWGQDQINWIERAVQRGDGQLNVVQLASSLRMSHERSRFHPVHVTGSGVDEWRYHVFGSKTLLYTARTKVNFDDILNSRILYSIPISAMGRDRSVEVRNELLRHLIQLETELKDKDVLKRTDIMFVRHRHPTNGGAYLSAESGIGNAILPFCFKELESFCFSMKHTWRLAYHYGFIRNLIEKGCLSLADIRTVAGGPAAPIRLSNAKKFLPLAKNLTNHFTQKARHKLLGRSIVKKFVPNNFGSPKATWNETWLNWAISEKLLDPSNMHSGTLYNPVGLKSLIEQTLTGTANSGEFLELVISVEMALRDTNTAVK